MFIECEDIKNLCVTSRISIPAGFASMLGAMKIILKVSTSPVAETFHAHVRKAGALFQMRRWECPVRFNGICRAGNSVTLLFSFICIFDKRTQSVGIGTTQSSVISQATLGSVHRNVGEEVRYAIGGHPSGSDDQGE